MNKRVLHFGNPAYLSIKDNSLVVKYPATGESKQAPVEDIAVVELDSPQLTITGYALSFLLANNVAILVSDERHLPAGLMVNPESNTLLSQRIKLQIGAKKPLKKNIWKQIVAAKVRNQMLLLKKCGREYETLNKKIARVQSGDVGNVEGTAANFYWKRIFGDVGFARDRDGDCPNNYLNYGYSVLRAITARAIVSSGLCPTLGIFHKNQYNAFCLADDLMEPYRIFVDEIALGLFEAYPNLTILEPSIKQELLAVAFRETETNGECKPLMNSVQNTCQSFVRILKGEAKEIVYPEIN